MDKQDWKERHSYHKISLHSSRRKTAGRHVGFFLLPVFIVLYFFNSKAYIARVASITDEPSSTPPPISAPAASSSSTPASASSQQEFFNHSATSQEIRAVIVNCADNVWGQETLDKAELLAKRVEEAELPDNSRADSVVAYLRMLHLRQGAGEATDAMLQDTAIFLAEVTENGVPDSVPERYRLALKNTAIQ